MTEFDFVSEIDARQNLRVGELTKAERDKFLRLKKQKEDLQMLCFCDALSERHVMGYCLAMRGKR